MRTLTIADNWKDWKFGDTDAVMTFTALDDDKVPDFSNRTLTFKIASTLNNDLEHPKDFAATATGYIQDKNVILKTEDVKQLTPGNYIVELWAMSNDTQKDAVYPSKGFAQFTIEENSMKVSDVTNIPSMTINAFWNAVMQKVRTLTKGAKGDPGKTPKIVIGSVTKLSPDAQPSATLVPLQSDPNTYTLNLQLPQGVQGEQGLQGIPGVGSKGLDGNNGLTPTIDPKTKHWMIGGTDTGVIAEGQAGKDADPSKYVTIVSFNQLRQQVQSNATALAQKAGKFELEDKLAQMNLQPEMYADLNAVNAAYPNGATKLIATDDGYLALYRDGKWVKGPAFQTTGIKDSDVYNRVLTNQNYFTDPTFTIDKPFTDNQTALTVKNINGTNWLNVVSSTGGGIGLEAKNVNDGLFQVWAKRLQCDLSNHANTWQTFNVEVQVYNVDDNSTVKKVGIGSFTVKPLTAYHINMKFTLPNPDFTNRYYRIFIFSNAASVDYDIANPVLKNEYKELPHDNNLLDVTNPLSPIGNVQVTTYYDAGRRYGNVTATNVNAENKGLQQIFELKPYGSGYGDKFRIKTEVRNEGTPGTVIVELRYLNADGSIGSSQLINRSILGTSQSIEIDRVIKLSTSEYAKNYQEASLAIYEENSADTHLLVNLDKTSVNYEANITETSQNLFGNWKTNHVISDGSTATDYYNDAETLNVYLAGVADYSTFTLPMSYNSKGMIDIDVKLVSTIKTKLKFQLNEYSADGSLRHINELRPETLLPNIARTVHITYNVTETDGDYYALVIYSQKEQLSFSILSATAQIHDSSRPLGDNSLPQVNLLANLDEGGAIAKGKVELIRGDTSHLYFATFKIQGDSTKTFPKKAWRITFYTDDTYKKKLPVRVFPDYPDVDSLNMKSNYIDWTQANNVIVSRCIADLTKLSDGIENKQMLAPNQCEITGEPCLGYNNGQKLGLFTLSPKKSNIMFNMEKGNTKMAVFEGNNVTQENCFKADSTAFGDDAPFTIEATDDDVDQSLKDSFNALLRLVNSSTDDEFKAQISSKLNLQSVANWIVSIIAFGLYDNTAKNICWATWDGIKWSAVQYDHDMAFGLWWDGSKLNHEESDIDLPYLIRFSRLFERLIKLHLIDNQLVSAWNNLKTAHPMIELQKEFRDWYYRIGDVNYEEDQRLWPDMPGQHYFHGEHVLNYIAKRYKHCDQWFTKDYLATL